MKNIGKEVRERGQVERRKRFGNDQREDTGKTHESSSDTLKQYIFLQLC